MNSLITGIHQRLLSSPHVTSTVREINQGMITGHMIKGCVRIPPCGAFIEKYKGMDYRMVSSITIGDAPCPECVNLFSVVLPPTGTFLQRHELADALTVDNNVVGCLYCFGRDTRVTKINAMCPGCYRAHKQEEDKLVEKRMIMGEVLGTNCADLVVGYMLYFFAGKPHGANTKNESNKPPLTT
jgi:hypothetical protein